MKQTAASPISLQMMLTCEHSTKKGFTLIELSIVLVIIGLLVGGILVGSDMIRVAELRNIVTTIDRFKTAINAFKAKYNCLPGDCTNATDYFGTASTCPGGPGTGTQTCNGNGNGAIDSPLCSADNTFPSYQELFLIWQHLSNAQLIQGHYTGFYVDTAFDSFPGINVPATKISGGGYGAGDLTCTPASAYNFSGKDYSRVLWVGANRVDPTGASLFSPTYGALLRTIDAMSLDVKVDDGLPGTGNVFTFAGGGNVWFEPNCVTTSNPTTAKYNLSYASQACSLLWENAF